ncbi:MAG: tripartite tricarboxylate transporter substrate binding protein [Burkholderiales bacterium]|jgi:tripartite-type tricarboxylate transporter receptor subunit TctC|nr:tripartite tricarboxylate transporter substrate binding protein [Burkholderiales bacterium]
MKRWIWGAALALALAPAFAQDTFPGKPVTLVVATPPGGVTDKVMRVVAKSLQEKWNNTPVLVDNRPGAAGNIASQHVAKAAPDGYTLLVSAGPFAINPALFRTLPFDTQKDFTPIGLVASFPSVLLVHESFPAKTYAEFVAVARGAEPLSVASPGNGTAQHLALELMRSASRLNINHIPYKGGAPAMNDLLAGHVKVMMTNMGDAMPQLGSGRIRPLALTGRSRSASQPNVPTFSELGVMDFEASGWIGLHAPAATSPAIIAKVNRDLAAALADPAVRQTLASIDASVRTTSVPEFRQFMDTQFAKWKEAVDLSGAKVD